MKQVQNVTDLPQVFVSLVYLMESIIIVQAKPQTSLHVRSWTVTYMGHRVDSYVPNMPLNYVRLF